MLAFSVDHPHDAPIQYPVSNPPFVPTLTLLLEAQPLLVSACALIANEAGYMSGQSAARMYCYNTLSSNNWQNTAFADVVKIVCDFAVLKYRIGEAQAPAMALTDAVQDSLTMYASFLVMSYPELAQLIPREQLAVCTNNYAVFQDLQMQMDALYGVQPQQYQQTRQTNMSGRGQPPIQNQRLQMGRAHVNAVQPVTNNAARGAYQGRGAATNQSVPKSRYPGTPSAKTNQPETPVNKEAKVDQSFITGEIENMKRDAHSIVYFGKKYEVPTSPLRRKLEEAAETHENLADSKLETASPFISNTWLAESSLDELIASTRVHRAEQPDIGLAVYVSYGMVVTPIISAMPLKETFSLLSKATNFSNTASILTGQLMKISDKEELRKVLAYVSQIDRILTRLLNDFLQHMVSGLKMRVSSFIEDAPALTSYLNTQYNGEYNNLYTDYQRLILACLFKHTLAESDPNDSVAHLNDYSDNVLWENMVVSYSITYISASSQELGYSAETGLKRISPEATPMLHRLIKAVQKTHEKGMSPSHHLIITSDDARFMFYAVGGKEPGFALREI